VRGVLQEKLATSEVYGTDEMLDIMVDEFEKKECLLSLSFASGTDIYIVDLDEAVVWGQSILKHNTFW
jgi:hypothetical protein